jgi:aspartate racemase
MLIPTRRKEIVFNRCLGFLMQTSRSKSDLVMTKLKIGILGGTSPQSTVDYYNHLINFYLARFTDHAYPEVIIYSVNFQNYIDWMNTSEWDKIEDDIIRAINKLEEAGADFGIIASGTLHKVFPGVAKRVNIPLLSMVECLAAKARKLEISRIGLLGTRFTMVDSFFSEALSEAGIDCITPQATNITTINDILFEELVRGIITDESRGKFIEIIGNLVSKGAQGVILGCTEIPLLISQNDVNIPIFDAALIHVEAALEKSLG